MKDILLEWNPWWNEKYSFTGVKRDKLKEVLPWIKRKEIISIIGVRRAGKTTLFYEIIEHLINKDKINPQNLFFIKADDDRIQQDKLIDNSLKEYYKLFKLKKEKTYLFIDEIQEIPNWQKTIKRIYDLNPNIKIFLSGSNSSIIKKELGSVLAGRFSYFEIFPFSFKEFLKTKNINLNNKFSLIQNKNILRKYLEEYLEKGAFPEVILEKDEKMRKELIRFYFDSIFYRDIIKRHNIRNSIKMEKLVKYLLQNTSNLLSFSKIAKLLELTTDSVGEYIKALEDAYLIFNINLFEFSYKKQIINPKKVYCVDNGIRNIVGFKFSEDIGRVYENMVFIKLRREGEEIYYWKNKKDKEVDFVIKDGIKVKELIQVCYNVENSETQERETSSLIEASKELKCKNLIIITENTEKEEKIENQIIKYIPLWKWLLLEKI